LCTDPSRSSDLVAAMLVRSHRDDSRRKAVVPVTPPGTSGAGAFEKTRLCKFHEEDRCLRGLSCTFAHSQAELKVSPTFKSKLCGDFSNRGACAAGANCAFAHGVEELRRPSDRKRAALAHGRSVVAAAPQQQHSAQVQQGQQQQEHEQQQQQQHRQEHQQQQQLRKRREHEHEQDQHRNQQHPLQLMVQQQLHEQRFQRLQPKLQQQRQLQRQRHRQQQGVAKSRTHWREISELRTMVELLQRHLDSWEALRRPVACKAPRAEACSGCFGNCGRQPVCLPLSRQTTAEPHQAARAFEQRASLPSMSSSAGESDRSLQGEPDKEASAGGSEERDVSEDLLEVAVVVQRTFVAVVPRFGAARCRRSQSAPPVERTTRARD